MTIDFDTHPSPHGTEGRTLKLVAGMQVLVGNELVAVSGELAAAFSPGDRIVGVNGQLLHVPGEAVRLVDEAVDAAHVAFRGLASVSDESITAFYAGFADRLQDDITFAEVAVANEEDVTVAIQAGRSTTRLRLSETMRADMIEGLRTWANLPGGRDSLLTKVEHVGWTVEQRTAPLGVIGFVFEGRPNVFADACGVMRSGNTVVFRIGSDALRTARAIMENAVKPALAGAGLPEGSVGLLDSPSRATGWALFSHTGLSLAVARGSGSAVAQLGAVARQSGVPVSLHGTGGGWLVAGEHVDPARFSEVVRWSLDRKVCNTLNVCVVLRQHADEIVPRFIHSLRTAAEARGTQPRLHVVEGSNHPSLDSWFTNEHHISRAEGPVIEPAASWLAMHELGTEWEWEGSPEVTLAIVDTVEAAVRLFNTHSPRLVASLISESADEQQSFYDSVNCPFVGDGFTRWVDGQFALNKPELGLSNWENGRLFARSAVLSGDTVFTVRTRARQTDPGLHR
jgi:glutamate-5-semialdehyde dehydrogenase